VIRSYNDFVETLLAAGFSMGGGNSDGIYSVVPWSWNESPPYKTPVCWHTGNAEIDPWEWRIRVLEERKDIAYAKLFFRKSGYIVKNWYPYFLAARRSVLGFENACAEGTVSRLAKRIYDVVDAHDHLPIHAIKHLAGFTQEDKPKFDRALTELQMRMFLTMCGRQPKLSQHGEEYGWASTVFCTTERFFGKDMFKKATGINAGAAADRIREQILKLNPSAHGNKISKFIFGSTCKI